MVRLVVDTECIIIMISLLIIEGEEPSVHVLLEWPPRVPPGTGILAKVPLNTY